ncbi:Hypothetical protein SMAX5B_018169 [Scophthalmus maximus]|uniref:Uncharacterized protein n=1 Tax=Scophthalmus maximus TaxID=52904 RepID=A0A2U9CD31_SCOMX|nr:Hypothetical protein SMAX5B_018169 [Scophthalmus maximus]
MALGEAKADILQGSWQGWDCKSADDEKHAPREPASTEQNILKKQSNRSSKPTFLVDALFDKFVETCSDGSWTIHLREFIAINRKQSVILKLAAVLVPYTSKEGVTLCDRAAVGRVQFEEGPTCQLCDRVVTFPGSHPVSAGTGSIPPETLKG